MTGIIYRMPMPVQPLKAMAAIVIAQKIPGATLYGGGLAIGILMLIPRWSPELLAWLARVIPVAVVRGVQFGLGLQLALLAGRDFISTGGLPGWVLAAAGIRAGSSPVGQTGACRRRWRSLGWAWRTRRCLISNGPRWQTALAGKLPQPAVPSWQGVWVGLLVLAIPQLPLSLGNSLFATERLAKDLFPDRAPTICKIGLTYSLMNLGLAIFRRRASVPRQRWNGRALRAFGARTGGSVVIYGSCFILTGLLFSGSFDQIVHLFPRSILGVLLFFEVARVAAICARCGIEPQRMVRRVRRRADRAKSAQWLS